MQTIFFKRYVGNKTKAYTHTAFLIFSEWHTNKRIKNATEIPTLKRATSFDNSSSEIFNQITCLKINLVRR